VIDQPAAYVTDDYAVLLASVAAGDVLFVHDVLTDSDAVKDLAVEVRVVAEDAFEASTEIGAAAHDDRASRVFHHAVGGVAGDEAVDVALVVCLDMGFYGIVHRNRF
jgi:hypothetical protein